MEQNETYHTTLNREHPVLNGCPGRKVTGKNIPGKSGKKRVRAHTFMVFALVLLLSVTVFSATIKVTNLRDSGPGSLRRAVEMAEPGDTIIIALPGTLLLTGGQITIDKHLTLHGPGADKLTISGGNASRIFKIDDRGSGTKSTVVIEHLSLSNGKAAGENGGAVYNKEHLDIHFCSLENNTAEGTDKDTGNGGAIYNLGDLNLESTTIEGNTASSPGGKTNSGNGGGIFNGVDGIGVFHGTLSMLNCTISGNQAVVPPVQPGTLSPLEINDRKSGFGGGIFNDTYISKDKLKHKDIAAADYLGVVEINHSTIAYNRADVGGGICNYVYVFAPHSDDGSVAGEFQLKNSIVSDNTATRAAELHNAIGIISADGSLVQNISGVIVGEHNIEGRAALLGKLANNGGTSRTHALLPGSPAVDAAVDSQAAYDQAGSIRKIGLRSDMGAYEAPLKKRTVRAGHPIKFTDGSGDKVTISLKGPGTCDVYVFDYKKSDASGFLLKQTDNTSMLSVKSKGTRVRDIIIAGSLGKLDASTTHLYGSVTVSGSLGYLALGDVTGPGRVEIHGVSKKGAQLRFKDVRDLEVHSKSGIQLLAARSLTASAAPLNTIHCPWFGKIDISGIVENTVIRSTGNIGEVYAGSIKKSRIYAGMSDSLEGMPIYAADFKTQASISKVVISGKVKDAEGHSTIDSIIAGAKIGNVELYTVKFKGDMPIFGVAAKSIDHIQYLGPQKSVKRYRNLRAAAVKKSGNFHVLVHGEKQKKTDEAAAALPWSFAVLDDCRGGVALKKGIAVWNLEPLFNDMKASGCKFAVLPGDIVSGGDFVLGKKEAQKQYSQFFDTWNTAYNQIGQNIYGIRGNHECYFKGNVTRAQWQEYFGQALPRNGPATNSAGMDARGFTFSFSYNNAFFVMVDQYMTYHDNDLLTDAPGIFCMGPGAGNWLQEQIDRFVGDPSLQHCYVFGHCPLYKTYTRGALGDNGHGPVRDQFIKTISGHAEIYFCGHDHFYDHVGVKGTTVPQGSRNISLMHQVLVGTAGADLDWDKKFTYNPNFDCSIPQFLHETHKMGYALVTLQGKDVSFCFRAFNIKRHQWPWEFDRVEGSGNNINQWDYSFSKSHVPAL